MSKNKFFQKKSRWKSVYKYVALSLCSILAGITIGEWGYVVIGQEEQTPFIDEDVRFLHTSAMTDPIPKKHYEKTTSSITSNIENAKIVFIIDDMGMNPSKTRRIANIKGHLTLSFLPYADHLNQQLSLVAEQGHELMMHLPMEPMKVPSHQEPQLLTVSLSDEAFLEMLQDMLNQFEGYVGVNNHMGSKLTAHRPAMEMLMKELKKRNLFFIDSKTSSHSIAEAVAEEYRVPHAGRDIFIDHINTDEAIAKQLKRAEEIAKKYGQAIAIAHPGKRSIKAIEAWVPTLQKKGIRLVPMSELLDQ